MKEKSDMREEKKFRQRLEQAGCTLTYTGAGHYKVLWGNRIVAFLPSTGGQGRGFRNALAQLRRAGVPV